jgi:hypothetical protein
MYKTGEIKFSDIHKSQIEGCGLYAWYIDLPKENLNKHNRIKHVEKLTNLFHNLIKLEGEAPMESFLGYIQSSYQPEFTKYNFEDNVLYDFLREAVRNFLPPLYIGKTSNSISERLKKHANILNNIAVNSFDSDDNKFKNQLMTRIREKEIDKSWLYVKYVVLGERSTTNPDVELIVENILNRTFKPVLGRN